ncbi:uncharacterized protein LOC144913890 [Branchiostoma floridae x Branchiostoma belcheri]
MGRKLRHVLIFLLIILKEPNTPEADCRCAPSSDCRCTGMGLTSIPQNLPTSISSLDLTFNLITTVNRSLLLRYGGLTKLSLYNNKITMVQSDSFQHLSQLKTLCLFYNLITRIHTGTFQYLTRLKHLDLKFNQIAMIPLGTFQNLTDLEYLHLSRNQIATIQEGTFQNLPNLQTLLMDFNRITDIHCKAFKNVPRLKMLSLQGNQMSVIVPGKFCLLPSIRTLKLVKNPWRCDCRMIPFRLNYTKFPVIKKHNMICVQPAKFKRKKLQDINPEDLVCEESSTSSLPVDIETSPALATSSVGNTENNASLLANPVGSSSHSHALVNKLECANYCYNDTVTSRWFFTRNTGSAARPEENRSLTTPTLTSPLAITSDKSESTPGSLSGPVSGPVVAFVLIIGTIILTRWYNKRMIRHPPLGAISVITARDHEYEDIDSTRQGQSRPITESTANDHQYEDVDNHRVKTRQGQSRSNIQSPAIANLSRDKVAALKPNPMYKTAQKDPTSTEIASGDDHQYEDIDNHRAKTGQGQSRSNIQSPAIANLSRDKVAVLKPNPMYKTPQKDPTSTEIASGDDHQYEDIDNHRAKTGQGQSQANTQSPTIAKLLRNKVLAVLKPNPTYTDVKTPPKDPTSESTAKITATVMASGDDHHYEDVDDNHRSKQGRSQAKFGKSNTKNTASVMTSGDDHHYEDVDNHRVKTGQSQSQAIAKSNTKTTAVVMTRSDVEAEQGQCQAITESLAAKNLSYGTGPTASRLSPVYTTATHDQ